MAVGPVVPKSKWSFFTHNWTRLYLRQRDRKPEVSEDVICSMNM